MKRQIAILSIALMSLLLFKCAEKKVADEAKTEDAAVEEQTEWEEMDAFHMVMAEAFHPYKDDTNLAPAKQKADELAAEASKWADAAIPERVNNDAMQNKLQQLKEQTSAFAQLVKSGTDKEIGDELTRVHDLFHEIQEAWYGDEHDHHQ